MKIIDEYTGKTIPEDYAIRVAVTIKDDIIIYGYTELPITRAVVLSKRDGFKQVNVLKEVYEKESFFSRYFNRRILSWGLDNQFFNIKEIKYGKGKGGFPYSFPRRYEAVDNQYLFYGQQKCTKEYNIGNLLHYTFGLEFETSAGYIPEELCFSCGLIPLRDGSIQGLEYSTVVLNGTEGIGLLKDQVSALNEYTEYNKDCSLHMHLGGYPLDKDKIWQLYKYIYKFQMLIQSYISEYAFRTEYFKSNKKSYCKPLKRYNSFDSFYTDIAQQQFYGDFTMPHPANEDHDAKWRINSRYYMCNFVNLLCYNYNKTVEFRFLHPTFNFNRIMFWILTFNALLYNAEKSPLCQFKKISDLYKIYPRNVYKQLVLGLECLLRIKDYQTRHRDVYDLNNTREYDIFSCLNFENL